MVKEAFYLVASLATGAYVAWTAVELVSLRYFGHDQTGLWGAYSSPWIAAIMMPVFLVLRSRHSYFRSMRVHKTLPANVYPHKDPILGMDLLWLGKSAIASNSILEMWDDMFSEVGQTFWHNSIGRWQLMTNEAENVKAILSTQFEAWPIGGTRQMSSALALGWHAIFSANGPEWASARALIRPSFVRNQIADLECIDRHVENFLARLPQDRTKEVDLQELLYMFTMDTSTDFMFGYSTDMLVAPTEEAVQFTKSFEYSLMSSSNRGRLGWLLMLLPDKKLDESVAYCKSFIGKHVAAALQRNKAKERPYVFMNEMINSGAPNEVITEQLLAMVLGGRDTSASTMSSMFWQLARRPEVVRKIRREIEVLGGRRPTWEELKGLKYLNNVLKETLRLWAPVPGNLRCASKDTVLPKGGGKDGQGPLFVPKGTSCRFSLYTLQRRKDVFGEDADDFRPERWDGLRTSWEYLPFSGGPRICIGQQFALTMMLYLVARFFQTFDALEAADDRPMVQLTSATISLSNKCWVRLEKIDG
ncbi:hypothetical protein RJ55_01661 [Drechmeria coniospora]|nr:hypothetical protein RJ55_01661 [Drechmeria coniospora]